MLVELLEVKWTETGPERVGFIMPDGDIVEVDNQHPQPDNGFDVSIDDLEKYADTAVATWHTHPGGEANLSLDDHEGFMNYTTLDHYIVGSDGLRRYRVVRGQIVQVPLD